MAAIFAAVVACAVALNLWSFFHARQFHRTSVNATLLSIAELKAREVEHWRAERMSDAGVLMESPFLAQALPEWQSRRDPATAGSILAKLDDLTKWYGYDDVLLFDPGGSPLLSLAGNRVVLGPEAAEGVALAFRCAGPVLTDLHAGPGDLPPHLDVIAPFFVATGTTNHPLCAVILRSYADSALQPMLRSWPVPSRTAETLLVRQDGDDVLYLSELRHLTNAALRLRLPLDREELLSALALAGEGGVVERARDYHGVPVLAAAWRVAASPWVVVAKVDGEEMDAAFRAHQWTLMMLTMALILCAAMTIGVLWQRRRLEESRRLAEVEAEANTALRHLNAVLRTLRNVNHAIVRVKERGRLVQGVCDNLTENRGHESAWMVLVDAGGKAALSVESGVGPPFQTLSAQLERGEFPPCVRECLRPSPRPVGAAVGAPAAVHVLTRETCDACPLADLHRVGNGLATRVEHAGKFHGLIVVWLPPGQVADEEEQALLREIAGDVGFALHNMELEAGLKESEQRYRSLFEEAQDGIVLADVRTGELLDCNAALCRMVGRRRSELLGQHQSVLHPPGQLLDGMQPSFIKEGIAGSQGPAHEDLVLSKVGATIPVEIRSAPVCLDGRDCLLGVFRDITERKRAEQELAGDLEGMARLRQLGALFVQNGNLPTVLTEIVDAAIAISGADFGNLQLLDPVSGDLKIEAQRGFPSAWLDFWSSVARGHGCCGTALERGERVIIEDVEQSPVFVGTAALDVQLNAGVRAVQSTPLIDRSGKPLGMVSTHFRRSHRPDGRVLRLLDLLARQAADIIERAHVDAALRMGETRHRLLFEASRDAIMTLAPPSWKFTNANPATLRLFGTGDLADFTSRAPWEYSPDCQPDGKPSAGKAVEMIQTAMLEGSHFFEWTHRRLGGEEFPATVLLTRFELEGEALLQATVRDISAQRFLEAQLQQAQKLESIGILASGVAHEINNPIMGIMNYAELIGDKVPPNSEIGEYAVEIRHETERVATIVKNLLGFARRDKQVRGPARLCDIVDATLSLVRAVLRHDQVTLEVDVSEDLPMIQCRSQQIQQVIMNLVTNARDALNAKYPQHDEDKVIRITARQPGSRVSTSGPVTPDPSRFLRLTVEDHGGGIPKAIQARIFDPFFTTKPRNQGTGLGLSISHGIVRDHSGVMTVESAEGRWTRFHVDLPIAGPESGLTGRDEAERV
ncbi:MAG: PAS domain S-box protein [Verrucomicrobiales bacterium]|nr:PAS domain S-box protein [Verrucomicrobiales bacterium]